MFDKSYEIINFKPAINKCINVVTYALLLLLHFVA